MGLVFGILVPLIFISPAFGSPTAADLCPTVEGIYDGKVGNLDARINLICVEPDRLAGSLHFLNASRPETATLDASLNLNHFSIEEDEGNLILSNFRTVVEDRKKGSSKSKVSYIRVDLARLQSGRLSGMFMSANLDSFKSLEARKVARLSVLEAPPLLEPLKRRSVAGTYEFSTPKWGKSKLVFDVVAGGPVINILENGTGQALHLLDGPAWNGSGMISVMTPLGNGGEPDDKKLFYLRGRFLDDHRMEFFLVSPAVGIEGPFIATRTAS